MRLKIYNYNYNRKKNDTVTVVVCCIENTIVLDFHSINRLSNGLIRIEEGYLNLIASAVSLDDWNNNNIIKMDNKINENCYLM
jgi:hypothetical protein